MIADNGMTRAAQQGARDDALRGCRRRRRTYQLCPAPQLRGAAGVGRSPCRRCRCVGGGGGGGGGLTFFGALIGVGKSHGIRPGSFAEAMNLLRLQLDSCFETCPLFTPCMLLCGNRNYERACVFLKRLTHQSKLLIYGGSQNFHV